MYVFGSVVTGNETGASDVDILIILPSPPRSGKDRANFIEQIEDAAGIPLVHPFEFHLVDPEEAKWYFSLGTTFWDPQSGKVANL